MDHDSLTTIKLVARTHINANEAIEARQLLKAASQTQANDAEIWFLLGLAEHRLSNMEAAIDCYLRAIDLNPGVMAAHLELSKVYAQLGQQEKVGRHIRRVLQNEPHNLPALIISARNLMLFGQFEKAEHTFRRALEHKPDAVMAVAGLAELYAKQGRFDAALELIDPFLQQALPPSIIAIVFGEICQHSNRCQDAVQLLERLLTENTGPGQQNRDLMVALAKLHDRLHQYDTAFAHISNANRMKPANPDMAKLCQQTEHFISRWNTGFHSRLPMAGMKIGRIQPIFIVGMPRSGTTLAEQILASHPAIHGAGERKEIGHILARLPELAGTGQPYPDCLEYTDNSTLDRLADGYLDTLTELSGKNCHRVTDKMPVNFWHLGLINRLFPGAPIIHCQRDPLDTCLSCYFTDFAEGNLHTFDLENMGIYYRQYQKIMHHWQHEIGIRVLDLPYEAIVRDPEHWTRQLIEYCGLEWHDDCLKPHKNLREIATASFMQVRQSIYSSSIDRWRHYSQHLGPLREALDR